MSFKLHLVLSIDVSDPRQHRQVNLHKGEEEVIQEGFIHCVDFTPIVVNERVRLTLAREHIENVQFLVKVHEITCLVLPLQRI